MKVLVKVPAGTHITTAGHLALQKGCSLFVHNDKLYGVSTIINTAPNTDERLREWLTKAPHGASVVECE